MSVVSISYAQRMKVTDEPLDEILLAVTLDGPAMATMELQKELNLNIDQVKQVQLLNKKRYEQIDEADQTFKGNAIQRSKAIYSIHMEADKALEQVLKPEQLRVFMELEGRQNTRLATEDEK